MTRDPFCNAQLRFERKLPTCGSAVYGPYHAAPKGMDVDSIVGFAAIAVLILCAFGVLA
jgi:hypothetical protein